MPEMGRYCKAYPIERFQEFSNWSQYARDAVARPYLYLQENYTVTAGIVLDEDIVMDAVTDEWKSFCTETLKFEVPNWEADPALEASR